MAVITGGNRGLGLAVDQLDPESPYFGMVVPAHQTSKAALNALIAALSEALADWQIEVNSVCPGGCISISAGRTPAPRRRRGAPRRR